MKIKEFQYIQKKKKKNKNDEGNISICSFTSEEEEFNSFVVIKDKKASKTNL